MRMNTAIQCIILLACTSTCTSAIIKRCQCLKPSKVVNHTLIIDAILYNPRSYCNKTEVIVTLKDNSLRCLDPNTRFTREVLKMIQRRKAAQAHKMNTTSLKTTTASATVAPTSS